MINIVQNFAILEELVAWLRSHYLIMSSDYEADYYYNTGGGYMLVNVKHEESSRQFTNSKIIGILRIVIA